MRKSCRPRRSRRLGQLAAYDAETSPDNYGIAIYAGARRASAISPSSIHRPSPTEGVRRDFPAPERYKTIGDNTYTSPNSRYLVVYGLNPPPAP
jgi:hypothetical protein